MAITRKGDAKLSERQRKILINIADTMLPPDVGVPFQADEQNLIEPIELYFNAIGKGMIRGFGLLLYMFEYGAIILKPFFQPFSKMSAERREKYLEGWESSRFSLRRQMFVVLKFLICMMILSDKDVRASLGYDPQCLVESSQ